MDDVTVNMFSETTGFASPRVPEAEPCLTFSENKPTTRTARTRLPLDFLGSSRISRLIRDRIQYLAENSPPVLIQGEPGSGKTFAAQMIHSIGKRASGPFIKLDCRTLSTALFQQLLFGEVQSNNSDFSSEIGNRGRLQRADGGTLLLAHFDSLAFPLQKIVERQFFASGSMPSVTHESRTPDVRIIVTTEKDLAELVRQKIFSRELYRRLNSWSLTISPLRERLEDLGLLAGCFLNRFAIQEGLAPKRLMLDALKFLETHDWPGNLRELQNTVERACILDSGPKLTAEMLRPWVAESGAEDQKESLGMTLRGMERKLIETTFTRCNGNRERTAKTLDIGIRTLSGKLREYGYPPRGGPGSNRREQSREAA